MTKYRRRSQLSDHGRLTVRRCGRFFQYLSVNIYILFIYIYIHTRVFMWFVHKLLLYKYICPIHKYSYKLCMYINVWVKLWQSLWPEACSPPQRSNCCTWTILKFSDATLPPQRTFCVSPFACERLLAGGGGVQWYFLGLLYIPIYIHELI